MHLSLCVYAVCMLCVFVFILCRSHGLPIGMSMSMSIGCTEHDYDTCMRILCTSMYWFELIIICFQIVCILVKPWVCVRSPHHFHIQFFFLFFFQLYVSVIFSFKFVLMYACKCHRKNCCLLSFCWQCHRIQREWRKIKTLIIWLCSSRLFSFNFISYTRVTTDAFFSYLISFSFSQRHTLTYSHVVHLTPIHICLCIQKQNTHTHTYLFISIESFNFK